MNLLFLSDRKNVSPTWDNALRSMGFDILFASKTDEWLSRIRRENVKVVVMDLAEKSIRDFALLKTVKDFDALIDVILIGPRVPADKMTEAIRLGAGGYLGRPLDIRKLRPILEAIRRKSLLRRETHQLEKELTGKYVFQGMVGKNPFMLDVFSLIERVAPHPVSVLISGETGTGKEMAAQALHQLSFRKGKKPVVFDCTAVPETLFESELFGYDKGAFTGADKTRDGLFKEADGGTIFLDEIGDIPLPVQSKLLRVLDEHRFRPLGTVHDVKVDIRILSATNRNLKEDVRHGRFREDLYHRINAVEIKLPPLRKKKDDLPLLFRYFLEKYNRKFNRGVMGISQRAQKVLWDYDWPGNVRELENIMERAVMLCRETFIDIKDLPDPFGDEMGGGVSEGYGPGMPVMTLEQDEKRHILAVLDMVRNNKQKAAGLLGLSRQALYRKLRKHRISL